MKRCLLIGGEKKREDNMIVDVDSYIVLLHQWECSVTDHLRHELTLSICLLNDESESRIDQPKNPGHHSNKQGNI